MKSDFRGQSRVHELFEGMGVTFVSIRENSIGKFLGMGIVLAQIQVHTWRG
jgi:hypothetical protein